MRRKSLFRGTCRFLCLVGLALGAKGDNALISYVFEPAPLGTIRPQGWLRDTMELMADGLAGHEFDFYRYVKNSVWMGRDRSYSGLHEGAAYWFNYIVPLAYGLDKPRLKDQVHQFVDHVLAHQAQDGWLGPEDTPSTRDLWARFPVMLGLAQLAEADSTYRDRIIQAMHRFIELVNSMLRNHRQGYVEWGRARSHDMVLGVQWLYENYPLDHADLLLDTMNLLIESGLDWPRFFSEEVFPKEDVDSIPDWDVPYQYQHVVNIGQALKSGAVIRRYTGNDTLLDTVRNAVNWTFLYHGSPSGAIIGDERISGVSPTRGAELCGVVETMFSLSYLYKAIGDSSFADRCELTAYNALPVMLSPNWWAHQYVAQTNQPYSRNLPESPFFNVNSRGQTYGLEPHYPCCTVNHPQGFPKFLAAAYVRVGPRGLGHALLSPSQISILINDTNYVTINCQTNYPFEHVFLYTITAEESFDFFIRIPEWYVPEESYLAVNGGQQARVEPDPHTGMHKVRIDAGVVTLVYKLGARIRIESRANDTIAIHHGALLYALEIGSSISKNPPRGWRLQKPLPVSETVSQAVDYTITNTTAWAIAIDPSTLQLESRENHPSSSHVVPNMRPLLNPIFAPGASPSFIRALACEIDWEYAHGGIPAEPPLLKDRKCTSDFVFEVRFVPYGAAKIHMAQLPTLDLSPWKHHSSLSFSPTLYHRYSHARHQHQDLLASTIHNDDSVDDDHRIQTEQRIIAGNEGQQRQQQEQEQEQVQLSTGMELEL